MWDVIVSIILTSLLVSSTLAAGPGDYFLPINKLGAPVDASVKVTTKPSGRLPLAVSKILVPKKIDNNSLGMAITAESALILDWTSGKILWQKKSRVSRPIASLTKLMTVLVFLEHNPGWEKTLQILGADQREGGNGLLLIGEKIKVSDLFNLALVRSNNTAAAVLARSTGLTEADFVLAMNQKAQDLAMLDVNFVEPTGLDARNRATAEDVALLLREALNYPEVAAATILDKYTVSVTNKDNSIDRSTDSTNWLLGSFLNQPPYKIVGGKTGYLIEAGYCLATVVEKSGARIISVVLGSQEINDRFDDTKSLVDWTFNNYLWPKD